MNIPLKTLVDALAALKLARKHAVKAGALRGNEDDQVLNAMVDFDLRLSHILALSDVEVTS